MVGSVYGVLAVTQTLMFRTAGVLSFAHGGFALIGAYTYAGLSCRSGGSRLCAGEPLLRPWQNAAVAVALATLAALAIERLVMRPLQSASATHKLVASAGALALCSGIMLQINGPEARMIPNAAGSYPPALFGCSAL